MVWVKSHQVLSYFLFSLVAFCLFFLLGPVSTCSAVSQSIDYSSNPGRNTVVYDSSNNTLGFIPTYLRVTNLVTGSCSSSLWYNVFTLKKGSSTETVPIMFDSTCVFDVTYFVTPELTQVIYSSNSFPPGQLRFTFYDSNPFESSPCPEIPETPYGDILDKIYHAILISSATMLVIYFFFIMFKWYLGGQ